jgi:hypothetical protein
MAWETSVFTPRSMPMPKTRMEKATTPPTPTPVSSASPTCATKRVETRVIAV